jgi:hypothetical protein
MEDDYPTSHPSSYDNLAQGGAPKTGYNKGATETGEEEYTKKGTWRI